MKYNKNVDTLLFLMLFTMSKCKKKNIEKMSAGTQKCEKQHVLGVLYPNIYQILKVNFQ